MQAEPSNFNLQPSTFAAFGSYGGQPSPDRPGLPTEARCARALGERATAERRLVENTGLEPVTSWLQTRRSPS
jgi:hypothetical protein